MLRVVIIVLRVVVDDHLQGYSCCLCWYRRKCQTLGRERTSHVRIDHNKGVCKVSPCLQPGFVFRANQFPHGGFSVGYHRRRFSKNRIYQYTIQIEKPVNVTMHLLFHHKIATVNCRACGRTNQAETTTHTSRHSSAATAISGFYNTFARDIFDKISRFSDLIEGELAIIWSSQLPLSQ